MVGEWVVGTTCQRELKYGLGSSVYSFQSFQHSQPLKWWAKWSNTRQIVARAGVSYRGWFQTFSSKRGGFAAAFSLVHLRWVMLLVAERSPSLELVFFTVTPWALHPPPPRYQGNYSHWISWCPTQGANVLLVFQNSFLGNNAFCRKEGKEKR